MNYMREIIKMIHTKYVKQHVEILKILDKLQKYNFYAGWFIIVLKSTESFWMLSFNKSLLL